MEAFGRSALFSLEEGILRDRGRSGIEAPGDASLKARSVR